MLINAQPFSASETSTSTSRSSSTNDNFFGQARAKHSAIFGFILLFHLHVSGEWLENICITHNRKTLLCTTDCYAESSRVGGKANAVCLVAPCHEGCHGCQKMLENVLKCTCPHVLPSSVYPSSTAQGGGGSFKKRKTIGEIGCCESRMSKQRHLKN